MSVPPHRPAAAEETGTIVDNPLGGLWDLALPPTLKEACLPYGVSDLGSISSSVARGKLLAKSRAGGPIKSMSADKYGAIVLYTGNSIYRELNRALREVHDEVPKYLRYLRLLFEAMDAMPTRTVRLWRGIAADLYDEYEPGKVITWWSVSSATADESVARGFMSQLGGVASLIILDTKSALDITPLSVYPKEKECLLLPGTRLKVQHPAAAQPSPIAASFRPPSLSQSPLHGPLHGPLHSPLHSSRATLSFPLTLRLHVSMPQVLSRTRHGNINEIHVEEIDTAVEPRPAHALVAAPEPSAVAGADADEEAEHPYSRFTVEAAKSNRSTCKGCGLKIDKGEVRIGCELEDLDGEFGGHAITQWRHVHCVQPSWVKLDELDGLGSLNKAGKTSIEAWHRPHKPRPGTSPAPPVASPVASSDMEASAAQTQRPAHAAYSHYFAEWDGRDAERLEGVGPHRSSASVLPLPHGVELRSSSRSRGGPLRADMFNVSFITDDHPFAAGALSKVVHIKIVHTTTAAAGTAAGPATHGGAVPYPLLLRMRHRASAEQFGQLAFYRAETPDSEMQLVEGGCFWSDGCAEVEVTSFSVWMIAPFLGRLADWVRPNSRTRTYIDRPLGVAAFAPTDPEAPRILRFVLHPAQDPPPDNHFFGLRKVGDDKEVTVARGQVVTIALKDRPELCVEFDPWDNTRQSQTLELGPSSSDSPRIAVISQPGGRQRSLHLLGLSEVQAIMALPDTWQKEAGADVEQPRLVEVPSLVGAAPNPEFEHVASLLVKGLPGASILGLKRVQNARLWENYAWECHGVARKNGGQSNERELWHSTGNTPADVVCMSELGFDPTYSIGTALRGSGTDGNKYGIGVYFAEHALYSDVMRPRVAQEGGNEIVLAKVVLGNVKDFDRELAPDLLREPIDERTGIAYDSWTGTENNLIGVTEIEAVRLSGSPSANRARLLVDEGHKYGRQYIVCRYQKAYPAYVVRYEVLQDGAAAGGTLRRSGLRGRYRG